ncbi:MAG: TonB-dependent receptor plug domain-containing protein [Crocinitomicaceae bacterium]|nr:TonB-dependent receptor [Flavobacteriales bacterium]NQZ34926.1 TonB-dependent receptor plug domain-containing protein [Crocinitomicaceae bacterium]
MPQILVVLLLFLSGFSFAQEVTLSGRTVDRSGKPVENILVYSSEAISSVDTDEDGKFRLVFSRTDTVLVKFRTGAMSEESETLERTVVLTEGENILDDVKFSFLSKDEIIVVERIQDPFDLPVMPFFDIDMIPMGSVERGVILTAPGVTSNNELTSNYNVRGGSYDENLVYVNGFQIYRPFLTRSGQQEGMSFINSALVKNISFSGGGFDSQFGDKLSSVLDIEYKTPSDTMKASIVASLLGVEGHLEQQVNPRFNYLIGARYRSNGYFLNSLPTKGAYNPVFWDAQFLTNVRLKENITWSTIGHFSSNNFRFSPETQRTDFGTANEAYSFVIYFDGQEQTRFQTMMGGTSVKWEVSKKTNLDFYATVFNTDEREYFDIQGQYFINELESDPSKEEYGDSISTLGIGTFLNHARNRLNATIFNIYHNGDHEIQKGFLKKDSSIIAKNVLKWGVNFQMDDFTDRLSEWRMIDSAGYSVPQDTPNEVVLFETIKGNLALQSQRYTSFIQLNSQWSKNKKNYAVEVKKKYRDSNDRKYFKTFRDTFDISAAKWTLRIGSRAGYTTANNEFYITPRASVSYSPRTHMVRDTSIIRRGVNLRFSTGMYYQPPFYREFRTFTGNLNMDVKSQKSAHFVAGGDVYFNMWNREVPFKFTAEAYYKYLWDVNPYEIENVRTRYYAHNDAVAYAYGLDLNIYGQFVEGIESFFKIGFLSTKEDILNDFYDEYYNAAGEKIIFGFSDDQTVVDSSRIYPGYIPRPTDQWLTFGALIQDRMPKYESFSVQVGVQYGAPLPYGPPDFNRYKDTLRIRAYFRVDIGMSYDFLYKAQQEKRKTFWTNNFDDAILSFEVFNLLGVNNVLSKQWIQDVEGKYYSIPNYLTQRRFNLKLILRF